MSNLRPRDSSLDWLFDASKDPKWAGTGFEEFRPPLGLTAVPMMETTEERAEGARLEAQYRYFEYAEAWADWATQQTPEIVAAMGLWDPLSENERRSEAKQITHAQPGHKESAPNQQVAAQIVQLTLDDLPAIAEDARFEEHDYGRAYVEWTANETPEVRAGMGQVEE